MYNFWKQLKNDGRTNEQMTTEKKLCIMNKNDRENNSDFLSWDAVEHYEP